MTTKAKRSPQKRTTEHTYDLLHAAFVTPRKLALDDPPTLRELARTFGAPFREVDRRAAIEHWDEEREANEARAWLAKHAGGATTEEEFYDRHTRAMYRHILGTPEGDRWVHALARRLWVSCTARISLWEATLAERAANEALDRARQAA